MIGMATGGRSEAKVKLARSRGIRIAIDRTVRSIAREGGRLLFGTGDGRPVFARSVVRGGPAQLDSF